MHPSCTKCGANKRSSSSSSSSSYRRASKQRSWKGRFSREKCEHLKRLLQGDPGRLPRDLPRLARGDPAFVAECLLVSLERWDREDKTFDEVFRAAEKLDEGGGGGGGGSPGSRSVAVVDWPEIFTALFLRTLELDDHRKLKRLLSLAHDSNPPMLPGSPTPPPNHPALLLACQKNDYEAVGLLVARGYRLFLSYLSDGSKKGRAARGEATWADYLELTAFQTEREEDGAEDDLQVLNILRMMSRSAYIFACYTTVAERKGLEGRKGAACECEVEWAVDGDEKESPAAAAQQQPPGFSRGITSVLVKPWRREPGEHFCPASKRYAPSPDCREHLECNDPVFRCFDIARVSCQLSKYLPQYRTELQEVEQACRDLSARVLSKCENPEQVRVLMEERTASGKYVYIKRSLVQAPRLRIAIEENQKDFVSHVHCQHFLASRWYGETAWQSKMLPYKASYFLLQTVLTPLHVLAALFAFTGREIGALNGDRLPPVDSAGSRAERAFLQYLHYCRGHRFNLDLPLNKFISSLGFFLLFEIIMIVAVMKQLTPSSNSGEFHWYHTALFVYCADGLYNYFLMFLRSRSRTFFDFWRMCSLISIVFFLCSLSIRLVMVFRNDCQQDIEDYVFICPEEHLEIRRNLNDLATMLFSFACVLAFIKLTYYLQLQDKLGPIIIVSSKVMLDIGTMIVIYLIVMIAFSFGFIYAWASDVYVSTDSANASSVITGVSEGINDVQAFLEDDDHDANFLDDYLDLLSTLFWSILDPGPYSGNLFGSLAKEYTTKLVFATFEIVAVIILLNLLIATMNTTIQKVESR